MFTPKIVGMVVAMATEYRNLFDKLGELKGEYKYGNITVTEFGRKGMKVFLADSGIGEISAALATELLIIKYGAEVILNFGMVGALTNRFKCKDVVLADEVVHYDFTLQLSDANAYGKYTFNRDSFILPADKDLLDYATGLLGDVPRARLMSGDKFVDVSSHKEWLKEHFGGEICDMESAGIHLACRMAGVPYLMIKTVSDNADEEAQEDFSIMAKAGVNAYVESVLILLDNWVKD